MLHPPVKLHTLPWFPSSCVVYHPPAASIELSLGETLPKAGMSEVRHSGDAPLPRWVYCTVTPGQCALCAH